MFQGAKEEMASMTVQTERPPSGPAEAGRRTGSGPGPGRPGGRRRHTGLAPYLLLAPPVLSGTLSTATCSLHVQWW